MLLVVECNLCSVWVWVCLCMCNIVVVANSIVLFFSSFFVDGREIGWLAKA